MAISPTVGGSNPVLYKLPEEGSNAGMMHVSVDSNTRRRQQPLNGCSTPCWAIRAGRETGYCRLAAWPGCQCFNQRCSAGVALPVRDFYFFIGYF